jgi:hypothetical protein
MTKRALFSLSEDVFERFRALVPDRERSKIVENYMLEEIRRRETERDNRLERLARIVENDPQYADVRAVSELIDAVAGEAL